MAKGKVKWYNFKKGYGFIIGDDDGEEYFVHYTQLPKGVILKEETEAEFEVKETEKGKQAINVQVND